MTTHTRSDWWRSGTVALGALAAVAGMAGGCALDHPSRIVSPPDQQSAPRTMSRPRSMTVEATRAVPVGGVLVAGRRGSDRASHVWRCPRSTVISTCRQITPPGMVRSEYVEDIDVARRHVYWLLTIDVDRQRGRVRITDNGGRTWTSHPAPTHALAAGSKGRIETFDGLSGLLTQYSANGPVLRQDVTDDGGLTWHSYPGPAG